jgi:hypothetical protein
MRCGGDDQGEQGKHEIISEEFSGMMLSDFMASFATTPAAPAATSGEGGRVTDTRQY